MKNRGIAQFLEVHYFDLQREKRELDYKRFEICAKIEAISQEMDLIEKALRDSGYSHICEHFQEEKENKDD